MHAMSVTSCWIRPHQYTTWKPMEANKGSPYLLRRYDWTPHVYVKMTKLNMSPITLEGGSGSIAIDKQQISAVIGVPSGSARMSTYPYIPWRAGISNCFNWGNWPSRGTETRFTRVHLFQPSH